MNDVTIVGLGLIGGSLALALRQHGVIVRATDADRDSVARARRAGIDAQENLRPSLENSAPASLMICTPISAIAAVYREYHRVLTGRETRFFHAGGLQSRGRLGLTPLEEKGLIGTHPLAGSHAAGFDAAREDLFLNCTVIIERRAAQEELRAAMEIWSAAGASRIVLEDAELHDARMPVVSHLPQIASTILALTIHERGYRAAEMGTGGRDATRLAASPFAMWVELMQRSRDDLVPLLARLQWNVGRVRELIAAGDWQELEDLWMEAASLFDAHDESRKMTSDPDVHPLRKEDDE
jgi:prephenate dehydrogenase